MDIETKVRLELARRHETASLRRIVAEAGLPPKDVAIASRIARSEYVSADHLRRIGRALGVIPKPRKLFRPVVDAEEWREFQEWRQGKLTLGRSGTGGIPNGDSDNSPRCKYGDAT